LRRHCRLFWGPNLQPLDCFLDCFDGQFVPNMPRVCLVDRFLLFGDFKFGLLARALAFRKLFQTFNFIFSFSFSFSTFAYICVTVSVTFCVTIVFISKSTHSFSSVISNLFITIHTPIHQCASRVTRCHSFRYQFR
jgi:hypothetical protein